MTPTSISREHIKSLIARESATFSRNIRNHTNWRSKRNKPSVWRAFALDGHWSTPVPLFVARAHGAAFTCVTGHTIDFAWATPARCFGHSTPGHCADLARLRRSGYTAMLPTANSAKAGCIGRAIWLPYWQLATTATDANCFALRWARAITGRKTAGVQ